jgi:DNA invertase Pin-like site-specific DNA recombinase
VYYASRIEAQMIEHERTHLLSIAERLGWPVPAVYIDTCPRSGPAMNTLTDDIQAERYDCVMVDMLSRFSAEPADLVAFVDLCHRHGVTVCNGAEVSSPSVLKLFREVTSAWSTSSARAKRAAHT